MPSKLKIREIAKLVKGKSINGVHKSICGERIGNGAFRDVYVLKQNHDYVVKIERDPSTGQFANVTEWRNYINNKEYEIFVHWLAPCELINETGQLMIQRRVTQGKRKDYPKKVPIAFTDLKLSNFGWIDDRFACCDYAYLKDMESMKFKTAKWWK